MCITQLVLLGIEYIRAMYTHVYDDINTQLWCQSTRYAVLMTRCAFFRAR
jgi:hypothetical protein